MSTAHSQRARQRQPMVLAGYAAGLAAEIAGGLLRPLHFIRTRSDDARHVTHQDEIRIMAYRAKVAPPTSLIMSQEMEAAACGKMRVRRAKIRSIVVPWRIFFSHAAAASNSFGACSGCHLGELDARQYFIFLCEKFALQMRC